MADVCLILEGTYPYVSGGVSNCVHQLISMLPRTTFSLVYIGPDSDELLTLKFKLPPNVVSVQELFLFDDLDPTEGRSSELSIRELKALSILHEELHGSSRRDLKDGRAFQGAIRALFATHFAQSPVFGSLASKGVWRLLEREYLALGRQVPFINFFYTWRSAHIPIYRVLNYRYPKAQVYHSLCTGYAGLAAVQASIQNDSPLFITEHGIYAHERAIEISEADWLISAHPLAGDESLDALQTWWIEMFRNMSRLAYRQASEIITLFEGNRRHQIEDGAPVEKTRIIPNGISMSFQGLRRKRPSWKGAKSKEVFRLGFVGRVVPIKDIKMLIKAVCSIVADYPKVQCVIVGSTDEDRDYHEQCEELISSLGLGEYIRFAGALDVTNVYAEVDCLLLTSISEAQPLAVLEANSAGVPVIATGVGACEELLRGREDSDRAIGPSGWIAPIGDSEAVARLVKRLIHSPDVWEKMSLAGMERVSRFYEERELISRYDLLYRKYMAGIDRGLIREESYGRDRLPHQSSTAV